MKLLISLSTPQPNLPGILNVTVKPHDFHGNWVSADYLETQLEGEYIGKVGAILLAFERDLGSRELAKLAQILQGYSIGLYSPDDENGIGEMRERFLAFAKKLLKNTALILLPAMLRFYALWVVACLKDDTILSIPSLPLTADSALGLNISVADLRDIICAVRHNIAIEITRHCSSEAIAAILTSINMEKTPRLKLRLPPSNQLSPAQLASIRTHARPEFILESPQLLSTNAHQAPGDVIPSSMITCALSTDDGLLRKGMTRDALLAIAANISPQRNIRFAARIARYEAIFVITHTQHPNAIKISHNMEPWLALQIRNLKKIRTLFPMTPVLLTKQAVTSSKGQQPIASSSRTTTVVVNSRLRAILQGPRHHDILYLPANLPACTPESLAYAFRNISGAVSLDEQMSKKQARMIAATLPCSVALMYPTSLADDENARAIAIIKHLKPKRTLYVSSFISQEVIAALPIPATLLLNVDNMTQEQAGAIVEWLQPGQSLGLLSTNKTLATLKYCAARLPKGCKLKITTANMSLDDVQAITMYLQAGTIVVPQDLTPPSAAYIANNLNPSVIFELNPEHMHFARRVAGCLNPGVILRLPPKANTSQIYTIAENMNAGAVLELSHWPIGYDHGKALFQAIAVLTRGALLTLSNACVEQINLYGRTIPQKYWDTSTLPDTEAVHTEFDSLSSWFLYRVFRTIIETLPQACGFILPENVILSQNHIAKLVKSLPENGCLYVPRDIFSAEINIPASYEVTKATEYVVVRSTTTQAPTSSALVTIVNQRINRRYLNVHCSLDAAEEGDGRTAQSSSSIAARNPGLAEKRKRPALPEFVPRAVPAKKISFFTSDCNPESASSANSAPACDPESTPSTDSTPACDPQSTFSASSPVLASLMPPLSPFWTSFTSPRNSSKKKEQASSLPFQLETQSIELLIPVTLSSLILSSPTPPLHVVHREEKDLLDLSHLAKQDMELSSDLALPDWNVDTELQDDKNSSPNHRPSFN
jgi:hypothetical protein